MLFPSPKLAFAAVALLALFTACPSSETLVDAGVLEDSGIAAPVSCGRPEDCRLQGAPGVCRDGLCSTRVYCADDLECGLGEGCRDGACAFIGCARDQDCETGRCRTEVYACAECASTDDCPADRPVCSPSGSCVKCASDNDCAPPGPGYCDSAQGACVYCRENKHCPTGLTCGANGTCVGAKENASCSTGVSCDVGLICVNVGGGSSVCLRSCNLYTPNCSAGELCLKLTFQDSPSLVFESGAPLGVCSQPFSGLRFYKESCTGNNCQPNLQCVPDNAVASSCKAYCDPAAPACAPGELCHSFPGDYSGRHYGLCYPDTGYGAACQAESDCRSGLSCGPAIDPSAFTLISTACRFAGDGGTGLAPCTQDSQCRSGLCANDRNVSALKSFCYAACTQDSDCSLGGREGFCDDTSDVTIPPYDPTTIRGCRPACTDAASCAVYNPAAICRLRVTSQSNQAKALRTCEAKLGTRQVGESCTSDTDCLAGYCWRKDSRGLFRPGVCTAPCNDLSDCTAALSDGGSSALPSCIPTTFNYSAGSDGLINTPDDRDVVATVCAPSACAENADCSGNTPLCAVDSDPQATASSFVLRCRAPGFGSKAGGAACSSDSECQSNACAELQPPSTGSGRVCLEPCIAGQTTCGPGLTCLQNAAKLSAKDGTPVSFTACVP